MRRLLALGALFLVALLLSPAQVSAHSEIASTSPAAGSSLESMPTVFSLTFASEVDSVFLSMEISPGTPEAPGDVLAAMDRKTDAYAKTVEFTLPKSFDTSATGPFVLRWRYFGLDGHSMEGLVPFTVGSAPAETTTPSFTEEPASPSTSVYVPVRFQVLRAASRYAAFLFGGLLFGAWFWSSRKTLAAFDRISEPVWSFLRVFSAVALAGSSVAVSVFSLLAARDVGVRSLSSSLSLLTSQTSLPWLLLTPVAFYASKSRTLVLPASAMLAVAAGLSSHSADTPLPWFSVLFASLHVLSVIVWAGPLLALAFLRAPISGYRAHPKLMRVMAPALNTYAKLSAIAISVLLISGARQAFVIPGGWPAGTWGTYLVSKIGLFLLIVAPFGVFHHTALRLHRRQNGPVPTMRRTVFLESTGVLLTLVMAVVLSATH